MLALSLRHTHTYIEVVSSSQADRQWHTHTHSEAPACVSEALTDSVRLSDRGCQRRVSEMCLVSHSVDLISGRTVHSGPAVAPYITPAVIHRAA